MTKSRVCESGLKCILTCQILHFSPKNFPPTMPYKVIFIYWDKEYTCLSQQYCSVWESWPINHYFSVNDSFSKFIYTTALLFRFPDILAAFKRKMTTNEENILSTDTEACLVVSKSAFFLFFRGKSLRLKRAGREGSPWIKFHSLIFRVPFQPLYDW